ncbi:MAG TPA: KilA-N domain-containing protein [Allocoleopsis sp.]
MSKELKIIVQDAEIRFVEQNGQEYISLTDMARAFGGEDVVRNWMRNRTVIEFLDAWEKIYNPNFNTVESDRIKMEVGLVTFRPSPKTWAEVTNAIGIYSKAGRYGSGTFAHKDIAFEFGTWLSPTFKIYLIREFQRLKDEEQAAKGLAWTVRREIAKLNYGIHTDAVRNYLLPVRLRGQKFEGNVYASEADLLNMAVFGMTAKEWKLANPDAAGNLRDQATVEQLLVLSNLENLNAEFIKQGLSQEERLHRLNETAIHQIQLLIERQSPLLSEGNSE